jgi:hypothetical protein
MVVAVTATMASTGALGRSSRSCGMLDGKYRVGSGSWVKGDPAPGIAIDRASRKRIVFTVAAGTTLKRVCVKTGSKRNRYDTKATLPVSGLTTVRLSRSARRFRLRKISFDTEPTAPLPACAAEAPDVSFSPPVFIDRNRAGGEPVSVVAQDGSINVSAHAGTTHIYKNPDALPGVRDFLWGYTNQTLNWRSVDGGETWTYTGLAGTGEGPHSILSTGFSDPDYAMDQAGNLYNVEIDLANDAVYKSTDDGQSWPVANPIAAPGDRPWITALEQDELFLYVNLPKTMLHTTDPNLLVWEQLPSPPVTSKSLPDPLNPDDGLIGPVDLGGFAISGDDAQTWKTYRFGPEGDAGGREILGKATQFFGVVAVDNAGNVYQAAAGGYEDSHDEVPDGEVTFTYYERATGRTNQERINIPIPKGDALWPWVVAGDDGRVAVVWYQNLAGDPDKFYIFAAVTHNATGKVKCADGTTKSEPPKWTVMNVSGRPVHLGKICLSGTTCNAESDFEAGDRRLGDFFTVNFDLNGNLIIASGDTTLPASLTGGLIPGGEGEEGEEGEEEEGGKKPVGNPIFIRQTGGDRLLEEPIEPRETRPMASPVPVEP